MKAQSPHKWLAWFPVRVPNGYFNKQSALPCGFSRQPADGSIIFRHRQWYEQWVWFKTIQRQPATGWYEERKWLYNFYPKPPTVPTPASDRPRTTVYDGVDT